jgi:hypothetical protein
MGVARNRNVMGMGSKVMRVLGDRYRSINVMGVIRNSYGMIVNRGGMRVGCDSVGMSRYSMRVGVGGKVSTERNCVAMWVMVFKRNIKLDFMGVIP